MPIYWTDQERAEAKSDAAVWGQLVIENISTMREYDNDPTNVFNFNQWQEEACRFAIYAGTCARIALNLTEDEQ